MRSGPVLEHRPAHGFCLGLWGGKVGGLRDLPFGVGDDDRCLVLDRGGEFGVVAGHLGAGEQIGRASCRERV